MKAIKCKVILHGAYKELHGGFFDSISKARKTMQMGHWKRPYTIVPLKEKKDESEINP